MSFRRQAVMILSAEFATLDVSVKLTVLGKDYTIFISTESMKCFICGKYGHIKTAVLWLKRLKRQEMELNLIQGRF